MNEERRLLDEFIRYLPSIKDRIFDYKLFDSRQLLVTCEDGSKILYDGWCQTFRFINSSRQDSSDMDPKRCAMEFSHRLRTKMYRNGYSSETLSEEAGISRSLLYGYLNGSISPSFYNVIKLANILCCGDLNEFARFPK